MLAKTSCLSGLVSDYKSDAMGDGIINPAQRIAFSPDGIRLPGPP